MSSHPPPAQGPLLDAGPLPVKAIREQARRQLVDALDSRRGKKVLVLDPRVSGPLALIAEVSLLKEHGVEQLTHLSEEAVSSEARSVLYLARPTLHNAQTIARQVRANQELSRQAAGPAVQLEHSIFFVPRRSTACTRILEEEGVLGDVSIGEFPLDIVPFEADLLSLEMDSVFREVTLDGDPSGLFYVARAITKLQALVGAIPRVVGKGPAAASVSGLLQRLRHELTYEGLIDELLGIHNGTVELEGDKAAVAGVKRTKVPLNSADRLFQSLRNANFAAVGPALRDKALSLQADYQDLAPERKTVSEMKDFVKKLNTLPEMNRHTNIADILSKATRSTGFMDKLKVEQAILDGYSADSVAEQLEEMMFQMESPWSVLRLMCLSSITQGGVPTKRLDALRREFLLSYGHEQSLLLAALQRAALLLRQVANRAPWPALKAKFNLIVDNISESNPQDLAYTFSGYAPLSCRLVEAAVSGGWGTCREGLALLPGDTVDYTQTVGDHGVPAVREMNGQPLLGGTAAGQQRTVLVVFIGGVTFAEVAALRFLGRQRNVRFVVLTTKVITGDSLLQSFLPQALQEAAKKKTSLGGL
eukprot:jgi/Tetstr1/444675/TSEL_032523.t1